MCPGSGEARPREKAGVQRASSTGNNTQAAFREGAAALGSPRG